jgi:hypothetical protein
LSFAYAVWYYGGFALKPCDSSSLNCRCSEPISLALPGTFHPIQTTFAIKPT